MGNFWFCVLVSLLLSLFFGGKFKSKERSILLWSEIIANEGVMESLYFLSPFSFSLRGGQLWKFIAHSWI